MTKFICETCKQADRFLTSDDGFLQCICCYYVHADIAANEVMFRRVKEDGEIQGLKASFVVIDDYLGERKW